MSINANLLLWHRSALQQWPKVNSVFVKAVQRINVALIVSILLGITW